MDTIERLTSLFEKFPGIGPRQASRFVQFLLRSSPAGRRELVESIQALGRTVHQCPSCMRWHAQAAKMTDKDLCTICGDPERDRAVLAVVASDTDVSALEHSGTYRGTYFVLGGTISLASDKSSGLRIKQLLGSAPTRIEAGLKEIILAFPANPEGDATAERLRGEIMDLRNPHIKVTTLGRGLSTGSELEYADSETIKSALEGRR